MANSGLNISGIYKIESTIHPDRIYVGSAANIRYRRNSHFLMLKKNKHKNPKLQAHYSKYGETDLIFSVIAVCERKELMPIDGIIRPEQFFIWAYNPWFNISKIAGSSMGIVLSKETCMKIGNAKRGKPSPLKGIPSGLIPWNKGLNKETNKILKKSGEKISIANKGKPCPMKGKNHSKKSRNKMSKSRTGKIISEETRERMSIVHVGKNTWSKGRKHSQKTCNKRSKSMTEWWRKRKEEQGDNKIAC